MTVIDDGQRQKHLDLILNASGDGVYGLDTDGNTTFSNPAAERLTGYSSEEMIGKGSHVLIHHSHADGSHYEKYDCPIYAAFTDGKVHQVTDEVFWRKDGTSFPVEYVSTPIFDDGALVGAVVSFRDITERKIAEDALQESEERYRKIVKATHDMIFLVDVRSGEILEANDEACELLGYSRCALTAKTMNDLHQHELDNFSKFLKVVHERGQCKSDSLSCLANNGEIIPVRLSASIIRLKGDECVLVMAQDLREYKKAEKQARKLQSDLHHVARVSAMGEMASGMAHELNQPLTAVMNYMQACRRILVSGNQEQRDKVSDYMEKVIGQAERAGKIISGLRKYVEKSDANRTYEQLNTIVDEASKLALSDGIADDVEIQTNLAVDLPSLHVDKIQIQQVVFNLVRNAIEALESNGHKKISISTHHTDETVQVRVVDNGPGLDEKLAGSLFDSFATTKANGMGLGLSICRSIIEDHDGQICANSNSGGGMVFEFSLPVIADSEMAGNKEMADKQTVFIVDDDEAVRDSIAALLEADGFHSKTFASGDDFLESPLLNEKGCLIIDVRMPGLTGLEVQEKLAAKKLMIPVIIITGHGDLPMAVRAMKVGAIDFIEKPFDDDRLIESVRTALQMSAERWREANQVADIEQRLARLTARERDVLDELVVGNLNKVIAYNLGISSRTVEIHRARAMEKMQARNLAHLVRLALTAGLVPEAADEEVGLGAN